MDFSKDYQKAMYIFFFISLLLVPIQWEFKLLITSTIFLIEFLITSKFDGFLEHLIKISINTEILWQSRPAEDLEEAFNAMNAEDDNPLLKKANAEINKNVHDILRPKYYLYLIGAFLFLAGAFYLSEHWSRFL